MSRLMAGRGGAWLLACSISMLHAGCRIGYQLRQEGSDGAGAAAGDSPDDHPVAGGGGATSGSGAGEASVGVGGEAAGAPTDKAGQGGQDSSTAGDGGAAGDGGMGAGGETAVGSLPPLPCAEPLVWWTDFSTDPTAVDNNGDGQPDWVLRGGAAFSTAELNGGVWQPLTSKALDTFPPVNFTGRTQARVKMRDTNQTAPMTPTTFGGALFWINLDYQPSDFLAIYSSVTTPDGAAYEVGVFASTIGPTEVIAGPQLVPKDAFVTIELDFDPTSSAVAAWVDGTPLPTAQPTRHTVPNLDQFATAIAPQGTGEFDELWVATCRP